MRKNLKKAKSLPHAGFLKKRHAQMIGQINRIIIGQKLIKELEVALSSAEYEGVQTVVNRIKKSGIDFKNERFLNHGGYYDYCMGFAEHFLISPPIRK